MQYENIFTLADGRSLVIRGCTAADGQIVRDVFNAAHAETDNLLTYPDENHFTLEDEASYLREKLNHPREAELLALVDGTPVGTAGIEAVGSFEKIRHRCEFGVNILKAYWGLGIGRHMLQSCITLAREAGYRQMELDVVADNTRAIRLYQSLGFTEYGRNPIGFVSRYSGNQELVLMRLELQA